MKKKSFIFNCFALLLALAYTLSIVGIDVHSCHNDGKTYVALLPMSFSCEDIHPDDCHDGCECCHCEHHQAHDNGEDGCCSDQALQLLLSGDGHQNASPVLNLPVITLHIASPDVLSFSKNFSHFDTRAEILPGPDLLRLDCVLRV